MSDYPAIAQYREERKEVAERKALKGPTEENLQPLFLNLLNHKDYAKAHDYLVIAEVTDARSGIRPDGTLINSFRMPVGYWESKGPNTILEKEIEEKFRKGYSALKDNLLFENGKKAILYQDGRLVQEVSFENTKELHECLTLFVEYEHKSIKNFEGAIKQFKDDMPILLKSLREKIDKEEDSKFIESRDELLAHCQEFINPDMVVEDIREMLIQHLLTADIFERIFTRADFLTNHHLTERMNGLQGALLRGEPRTTYLKKIKYYYDALQAAASCVEDNRKQDFLKRLYEEFYKAYNPKAADRLGIVYTPTEIVKFIVRNADTLLKKHFGKGISDDEVDILDPATGTGTFICELLNHMDKKKLSYKYRRELHANEVSLLAYYIANLNIEHTYFQLSGKYDIFSGLCFVDTLDLDVEYKGKQHDVFAGLSEENVRRVKGQQEKTIDLIIGNPPYNDSQRNENENNKNREYPSIDNRIKDTFVKDSTAQKTHVYDMYTRFYRWAMDRLKGEGMIAFITNRSFIDAYSYGGFRQMVQRDFSCAYIVDLGGDIRAQGSQAGANVFGIMTGVAIMFLVKKQQPDKEKQDCCIHYFAYPDEDDKETKLKKLQIDQCADLDFRVIVPDEDVNWINQSDTDFKTLLPLCKKQTKRTKNPAEGTALFQLYSPGVKTNRDSWVYDKAVDRLEQKMQHSIREIKKLREKKDNSYPPIIKWSRDLKIKYHSPNWKLRDFDKEKVLKSLYRPFCAVYYYSDKYWSDVFTSNHINVFGESLTEENICICFSSIGSSASFHVLATKYVPDFHLTVDTQCLPLYKYNADGQRVDNITDWGLRKVRVHYGDDRITCEQIFTYTYAVLHASIYREVYALDLNRHLPGLPFYEDFFGLAALGQKLLDLHTDYETVAPYGLSRVDKEQEGVRAQLKRSKKYPSSIVIDTSTTLANIPDKAWCYKLGRRTALEWVLSQYKETHEDLPSTLELEPYRLADYKEELITLLQKVCNVSCQTVDLVAEIDQLTHL